MDNFRPVQGMFLTERVDNYGMGEEGVVRKDGFVIFVPYALKGELVKLRIDHVKRNYAYATLIEVIEPSPYRRKPVCTRFPRCGGCQLLHLEYSEQLKLKRANVAKLLEKSLPVGVEVEEVVSSDEYGYRNKLSLPFGMTSGRVSLGFYREGTHKVVSTRKCFLNGDWAEKLISIMLDYAEKFNLTAYTDDNKKGLLRHLVARKVGDGLSVTVVINGDTLPHGEHLVEMLKEAFSDFTLYISINREDTNVIFGDRLVKLYGEDRRGSLLGVEFPISPYSFMQVNIPIAEKILSDVVSRLSAYPDATVIDAYAGIGVLGTIIARNGNPIVNIEIVPSAVEDGKKLYRNLGIEGEFFLGDSAKILPDVLNSVKSDRRIFLLLDPPRKGLSHDVVATINAHADKIDGIVYISCNPATLARDIVALDFTPTSVRPYDMFPNTRHVESVVYLTRHKELPSNH